jgi:Zn-finger nucleic acid-binding protein
MSKYQTKKCNHCGRDINIQYGVCPLCGGDIHDEVLPVTAACPHCKVPLVIQVHAGDEYDFCRQCGGLWLDKIEFQKATRPSDVYRKEELKSEFLRGPVREQTEYIPCVRCGNLMNRKNFRRISGVLIDECGKHGVWLDAGELEKIQHFIADGGLDKSQDREIEQTRNELKELATKVDQTAFVQKILHFWNFKRWLFGG